MAFWDRKPRFETDDRIPSRRISASVTRDSGIEKAQKIAQNASISAQKAAQRLREIEKFKAKYPDTVIGEVTDDVPRMQATQATTSGQGQMWGWGWPRGYGAKFAGGMSTPYAGLSINHWQLRQQARDVVFDAPHATALVNRFADSVVGEKGLRLDPTPHFDILGISADEADEWATIAGQGYEMWCKSRKQNRSQLMNWRQGQHLLAKEVERDNDEFIRLFYNPDPSLLNPLQWEILDANMIRGDSFTVTNIIGRFPDGIERNDDGSEKSYRIWAQKYDQGNGTFNFSEVEVPRYGSQGRVMMLHGFKADYAGQGRGYAGIGAIVQEMEIIEDIILAVSKRSVNQSNVAMYVKPSANAPASNPWEGMLQNAAGPAPYALGVPGTSQPSAGIPVVSQAITYTPLKEATVGVPGSVGVYSLMEGEDLILPNAGAQDPQLKEFVMMMLGIISASRSMPLEILIMAFNSSYTASVAAMQAFDKICKMKIQDHDDNFEGPMYEMWLSGEIAAGRIACPGWNDPRLHDAWCSHILSGSPPIDVDPVKTATAAQKNLQMGATNLDTIARNHNGSSAAHNRAKNKKDVEDLVIWPFEKKYSDKGEDESAPAPEIDQK